MTCRFLVDKKNFGLFDEKVEKAFELPAVFRSCEPISVFADDNDGKLMNRLVLKQ